MTKYKKAILDLINLSTDHLTAEEVYDIIKLDMPKIVLATVYNNLNSLYDEHLIRKITVGDSKDRYDKIIRHDHLVCKKCKKLKDINLKDFTDEIESEINEKVIGYELNIFYICNSCKGER